MPLVSCPECKSSVSDQAHTCPTCGYPLRKPQYMTHIVNDRTRTREAEQELKDLCAQGWTIIDEKEDEWVADGYHCSCTYYKLEKR